MISFGRIYRKYIPTVAGIDKIDVLVQCIHLNEAELQIDGFIGSLASLREDRQDEMKEALEELKSCSYLRRGGAYELYPRIVETGTRRFFRMIMTQGLHPKNNEEEINVWVFGPASLNVHMMGHLCDVVHPPAPYEQSYTSMIEEHAEFVISLRKTCDDISADATEKERERLQRLKKGEKGLKKNRTRHMRLLVYGINNSEDNSGKIYNGETPKPNQDNRTWLSAAELRSRNRLDELYKCAVRDDELMFKKYWNEVLKKRNIRIFGGQLLEMYLNQGGEVRSAHAPPCTRILRALATDPAYTHFRYFTDLVKVRATDGDVEKRFNVPARSIPFVRSREDAELESAKRRIEQALGRDGTRIVMEAVNTLQPGSNPNQPTAHPVVSSTQPAPRARLNSVVMPDYDVC